MNPTFAAAALESFAFGVVTALAIGPIALFILNQAMTRGLAVAWRCALGAALADLTYAVAAFTIGTAIAPYLESAQGTVRAIGSVLLIALGCWLVWKALRLRAAPHAAQPTRRADPLLLTYLLTIANPMTILFMMGLATQLPLEAGSLAVALTLALCVFAGTALINLSLAAGGAGLRRVVERPGVIRALEIASGAGIVAFGLRGVIFS